jgi:CheY-like chemotaxis protein
MPFSVVYVDDDDLVRETITALLRMEGVAVTDFATGASAVRAVAADPPDAVLIDLNMPSMDGFAVARAMRAFHADLRLVAISGQATAENRNDAMDAGFDRFLEKPASMDRILTALGKGA